ncbi:MAG TPA: group II intron reverse transcriptase/maturase [Roseiarcus sp.]|nr:group II intron reverse transcriptase/maturase [Roseiarcus sp.]
MNGQEKSDPAIVAERPTNEAQRCASEPAEPRAGTEGNAIQQSTRRAQDRTSVSQALERIRQAARRNKKEKFTALLHHIGVELLETVFFELRKDAAPGIDGVTWRDYEADLDRNLADLHARVQRGAYRATPSRRVYIPKPDGGKRPLAVAALEDKIVQRATVAVLNAIYEEDFLGFSYGFRPGRGAHDALDALSTAIDRAKVNFIVDADIAKFFDTVSQDSLVRFLEHRIGDKRIIRLIRKWLKAGILEDGEVRIADEGTGQGSAISPLLANVYLHYALDLWAERWRRREAKGDMVIVRYADDAVFGFEHEADARRFLEAMRERLAQFTLKLHPDKTRLIEFGRHAAANRKQRGLGKPETFNFLGFTFICGKSRKGGFLLKRKSRGDRMRAKLREIKAELKARMHEPVQRQGLWLRQVVKGWFNYHAVPTNFRALGTFRHHVTDLWRRSLSRRSQMDATTWDRVEALAREWLPQPRILHPWPDKRFAVKHPRWEPDASIGPVRFCAGGVQQ